MVRRLFFLIPLAALAAACSSSAPAGSGTTGTDATTGASGSTSGSTGGLATCASCFDDSNCGSGHCIQLGHADSACLDGCGSGCTGTDTCQQLADAAGNPQSVCVPQSGACGDPATGACPSGCPAGTACDANSGTCVGGATSTSGATTTGTTGTSGTTGDCGSYAGPNTAASCTSCTPGGSNCQANGCYGGWYCDTVATRCVSPATACGTSTGTSGTTGATTTSGSTSAGAAWTGAVDQNGGQVSRLYFAAIGDSRPPNVDQTSSYPTAIITRIFQDIDALSPKPQFIAATGDYMFASPTGSQGAAQLQLYLNARSAYSGVLFPAMGNHECTGYTDSNCTSSSSSNNFQAFMSGMLQPIGKSLPYYRYDVNASNGQWSAKFIVLAMNAWDSAQGSWLQQQLATPTTYTFIIRHEPENATTAPGVTPSDNIISQYPYTLKIVGHTHEFYHSGGSREVIVGNGGAPLTGSGSKYGYALIQQLADGSIRVDEYDYQSNAPVQSFSVSP